VISGDLNGFHTVRKRAGIQAVLHRNGLERLWRCQSHRGGTPVDEEEADF